MLIVDTSGLVGAYDPADRRAPAIVEAIRRFRGRLVVSPLVMAEFDYLLRQRHGHPAARQVLDDVVGGAFTFASLDRSDYERALEIDRRYGDLGLGLADASLVVLAERYGTDALLTLDRRHFRAVRPLQGGAFRLLPEDD